MKKVKDRILKNVVIGGTLLTSAIFLLIIGYIVSKGIRGINLHFIKDIFPMVISTCYIILSSISISVPIGICAAIYLVEYAKEGKLIKLIRFAVESLAGIPSIIFGLFGMIFFVTFLKFGFSILAGSITLSIMVLPTIIRTSEEALKSVPMAYREGSLALGATKLTTIRKVVLPSAIPGIMGAVILTIGRIVGETAAVYLTAGMVPRVPEGIFSSGRSLSVHLYVLAKEGISFEESFATATLLIILVVLINLMAHRITKVFKYAK
ncbi:MAG: phosphate ABC transporter permease PstA [Anaeromicrobium sp.]|jgi:phosphate transport system permease protein|uniref:phosphate ABC transporter permease PstA n=1 Tax=Anaeromicrobium sp. TaxID=1929132 RepID=UPI0025E618AF|nr:phosphate ABC transporter permease PstA [Anaeromicrobium sp.]MCT4593367.1 phosphate ABC transporter permease PstA [Anaeromicrobium sp.]